MSLIFLGLFGVLPWHSVTNSIQRRQPFQKECTQPWLLEHERPSVELQHTQCLGLNRRAALGSLSALSASFCCSRANADEKAERAAQLEREQVYFASREKALH